MKWLILTAAGGLAVLSAAEAQPRLDACRNQIPVTLRQALQQKFPRHDLPQVSDTLAEDVRFDRSRGGDGCILVERADFDGDGREDLAIGLAAQARRAPLVVVALARGRSWALSTIRSWVDDISRLYVSSSPAGLLKRTEALDGPVERDERTSLQCDHTAVVVGATESTGIAYCFVQNRWLYVWISD
jgi:hypothetical protein